MCRNKHVSIILAKYKKSAWSACLWLHTHLYILGLWGVLGCWNANLRDYEQWSQVHQLYELCSWARRLGSSLCNVPTVPDDMRASQKGNDRSGESHEGEIRKLRHRLFKEKNRLETHNTIHWSHGNFRRLECRYLLTYEIITGTHYVLKVML